MQAKELHAKEEDIKNCLLEVTTQNKKVLADVTAAEQDLQAYMCTVSQHEARLEKHWAKLAAMNNKISKQDTKVQKLQADRDIVLLKAHQVQYLRDVEQKRKEE